MVINCKKSKIKLFIIYIGIIIIVFLGSVVSVTDAYAQEDNETDKIIERQTQSDEIKSIGEQIKSYARPDINEITEGFDPEKIIRDAATGKIQPDIKSLLEKGAAYIFKEIYLNAHILIKLVIIAVLCAILKNLQTSFLSESVGELAFYVCYILIVSIMLVTFNTASKLGTSIIDDMTGFMYATVPVLITLLVSGGNITTGGIFQPVLVMIVDVTATIVKNVFIPLVFFSSILSIVNNISDKIQISKAAGLLKKVTAVSLGFILTIFVAIVSVQGSLGGVADGVAGKTVKFAIGSFIPIVGGYLADAADTVIGCTLLIKNAAGIAVMIGIIVICIVPLLKILALIGLYKLTCVLIEPITEKRIVNCVNDIASSLTYILGITASVALMFLISVAALIGAGNLSAMIR